MGRNDDPDADDAVSQVLESVLPGARSVPRSSLIAATSSPGDRHPMSAGAGLRRPFARIWALISLGQFDRAHDEARALDARSLDGLSEEVPLRTRAICALILSEVCLSSSRCLESGRFASRAQQWGEEAADPLVVLHAVSLHAASLAVEGRGWEAEEQIRTARGLLGGLDGEVRTAVHDRPGRGWSLALAETLCVFRRQDGTALKALEDELTAAEMRNRGAFRWLIRFCRTLRAILAADFDAVTALADQARRSVDLPPCPPLLRKSFVRYEALALVQTGDPGAALDLLDGRESSSDHAVCFETVRASAHLQMGRPELALAATEGCARLGVRHAPLARCAMLGRRVVANDMLGRTELADRELSQAARLVMGLGPFVPLRATPREDLDALEERFRANEPALYKRLLDAQPTWSEIPDPRSWAPAGVHLSDREWEVALRLASDLTIPQIAGDLYVSVNTVKTQLRSIYSKLGVNSRREAVARLDVLGLPRSGS
ncbi:LuxR C-terminal-related transcriptional regulator [Schaalia naturae]|jgi:DNA-binding CsgD family transcriptional regulator|uniref:LuxR C-terminal-related transcriptional regulator n=1 Tax=Schaalia naturae TaxID=635203 RepID=A0ABW2SIF2_9ACTO